MILEKVEIQREKKDTKREDIKGKSSEKTKFHV